MDLAETYVMKAPVEVVGLLAVDGNGGPIEVTTDTVKSAILRKATAEPDVMAVPAELAANSWSR
jgi:hypothetical protein